MNHVFTGASGFLLFCAFITAIVCLSSFVGWAIRAAWKYIAGRYAQ